MNHIARLTADLATAQIKLRAKHEAIQAFRVHLDLDKFRGFEADGNSREWIAPRDVLAWLAAISGAGRDT